MKVISIKKVKAIREDLGATHIVIFCVDKDGQQQVATHGQTNIHAREAASAGNRLKFALGWPKDLCKAIPLERKCKNCYFYEPDYGIHCFNGWSDDGSNGFCKVEPRKTAVKHESGCSRFEPKGGA